MRGAFRPPHWSLGRADSILTPELSILPTCIFLTILMVVPISGSPAPSQARFSGRWAGAAVQKLSFVSTTSSNLSLSTSADPTVICSLSGRTCPSAASESRVLLSAVAPSPPPSWPAVQVAFVIETTAFDGVADPSICILDNAAACTDDKNPPPNPLDPCLVASSGNGPLCEESNGVPFLEDHLSAITSLISASNPYARVTYAMVDYGGSCDLFDDACEQSAYHVDSAAFLPGAQFATTVGSAFKQGVLGGGYILTDEDLSDNFLHSPSISALYGTITGSALAWSPNTHHVIVWMGSTAPRDPSYPENYCVSSSAMTRASYPMCSGATCEPAMRFSNGVSPNCEGWDHSNDGNPGDSIAALAHSSQSCANSIGGVCVIDTIDLWNTPTDPYSQGWPTSCYTCPNGSRLGPGTPQVLHDSNDILLAGCDLAAATGGTWDGPAYYSCPNGQAGGLQYVSHGPASRPNTANPTLMSAFRGIGFGPIPNTRVAVGAAQPLFSYVPFANIAPAPDPQFAASCETPNGYRSDCPQLPTIEHHGGAVTYGWNWSNRPANNVLYAGDEWSASFYVVNTGPPYAVVPVDACVTLACGAAGSGAVGGYYTWAAYCYPNTTQVLRQSFPLALVTVDFVPPSTPPPATVAPPSPPPSPVPIPVAAPAPVVNPVVVGLPLQSPLGALSIQATAAGLLTAGMTRVLIKNRLVTMPVAVRSGLLSSGRDGPTRDSPPVGRFE